MEHVESIRAVARTVLLAERSQQRNSELCRRRLLDETREDTAAVKYVASKLKTASAVSVPDLVSLKNGLISENDIQVFLMMHGALRGLVRELSGADTTKQCVAAACLCNVALGDARSALAVAKAAGAYLLPCLSSLNTDLAVTCAWTLGNLAGSDARVCAVLGAQGALPALTRMLDDAVHEDTRQAACYALIHFAYVLRSDISHEELCALIGVLRRMKRDAAAYHLLFLLSCHPHFSTLDTTNKEFVSSVSIDFSREICCDEQNRVANEASDKLVHIVRILANLCSVPGCGEFVLSHWRNTKFTEIEKALSIKSEKLRNSVLWLLGNIFNSCMENSETLIFFQSICDKIL